MDDDYSQNIRLECLRLATHVVRFGENGMVQSTSEEILKDAKSFYDFVSTEEKVK